MWYSAGDVGWLEKKILLQLVGAVSLPRPGNAVQFNHEKEILFLHHFFFLFLFLCLFFLIAVLLKVFPLPALLVSLQKEKEKKKKKEHF